MATRGAIELGAAIFGLGSAGRLLADIGGQLLTLRFGREDETEADLVGLELAARAGYDPRAGVTLWQKMAAASKGAPPRVPEHAPVGADAHQRHPRPSCRRFSALYARAASRTAPLGPPRRARASRSAGALAHC